MTKGEVSYLGSVLCNLRELAKQDGVNVGSELVGTDCGFNLTFYVSVRHECKPLVNLACDVLADKIRSAVFEICDDFCDYFETPSEEVPGNE